MTDPSTPLPPHPKVMLTLDGFGVRRGERDIVHDLSLGHSSGRFLQLLGANGAGKSTLLLAVSGLIPHEGAMTWQVDGVDLADYPIAEHMLFVSHVNAIKPDLTNREILGFWADMTGGEKSRIDGALAAAHLDHLADVRAGNMSKGQQRRLSISRLLIADKPIWLLDEPTSALDKQGDHWVAGMIGDHLRRGGFCVAATHRAISLDPDVSVETLTLGEV